MCPHLIVLDFKIFRLYRASKIYLPSLYEGIIKYIILHLGHIDHLDFINRTLLRQVSLSKTESLYQPVKRLLSGRKKMWLKRLWNVGDTKCGSGIHPKLKGHLYFIPSILQSTNTNKSK